MNLGGEWGEMSCDFSPKCVRDSKSWNRVLMFLFTLSQESAISGCKSVALNSKPHGAGDLQSWPLKFQGFYIDCKSEKVPKVSFSGQALCSFKLLQRTAS